MLAAFSRRTALPSFLTRFFTGGARWSHCGVVDLERGVIIEAQVWRGVIETPLDEFEAHYPSTEIVRIDCPFPEHALAFARTQVGKPYDYLGAVGVPWRTRWDDPARWYCSELVEAALAAGGRLRWRLDKRGVSPMESWMVL